MWMGSYFGDWDNESNLLRAPLGSTTYTLTASYSGFPHWLYHPMALGQTAGYCARLTQNNRTNTVYRPFNESAGLVHIALMGDPTLRMHPVQPPGGLAAVRTSRGVKLSWTASPEDALRGYHVYRGSSLAGPFTRLTTNGVTRELTFNDNTNLVAATYMVRAVKLERSNSGTYLNSSQGIFLTVESTNSLPNDRALTIARQGSDAVQVRLMGDAGKGFRVEASPDLRLWKTLTTNVLGTNGFSITDPVPAGEPQRFYRADWPP
jgi:hypothetical protein